MSELLQSEDIAREEKPENLKRVLVSIPNEGHAQVEAYSNRLVNMFSLGKIEKQGELLNEAPRFEFYFFTLGRMFTPVAREEAAEEAIKGGFDYLYMIDDDMICPDDMFTRLQKHDVDIIAPLAFTRNAPYHPVIYSSIDGWDSVTNVDYFLNNVVKNYPKDSLVECDAVGFGSALIKVDVFRKIRSVTKEPFFKSTCGTGEDIFFCYKAKKYGARVFVDTSVKLGHLTHPPVITEDFAENYWKEIQMNPREKQGEYKKYKHRVLLG